MKTYCPHCTPQAYVCKTCGRTSEERIFWDKLPDEIQEDIENRIKVEQHMSERLIIQLEEIVHLQSILNSPHKGSHHV